MSQLSARFSTLVSALLTGYFLVVGNLLEADRGERVARERPVHTSRNDREG